MSEQKDDLPKVPPERGILAFMVFLVNLISVGIAMTGTAWTAFDIFDKGLEHQVGFSRKLSLLA